MMGRFRGILFALPGLAGAALFFLLSQTAAATKSAVYDEPVHLLSGYRILTAGDHDFNHEHPPLMKLLAAVPLVATGEAKPLEPWRPKREADQWPLSHRWLHRVNDADRLLGLGRMPIALAGACLAFLVFMTTKGAVASFREGGERAGLAAGCVAAALFALEPNLLAHGSLVTTDMGMALFYFAAAAAFWRLLETRVTGWLLATGVLWGLGFLAKFTAIMIVALLPVMAVAYVALEGRRRRVSAARPRRPAGNRKRRAGRSAAGASRGGGAEGEALPGKGRAPGVREDGFLRRLWNRPLPWSEERVGRGWSLTVSIAAIAVVALLTLNAGYGFHGTFTTLRGMELESASMKRWAEGSAGSVPLPVPAPFVAGYDHAEAGGQRWWSYLMGEHSMTGWWYYYLVALLVKSPIPLLLLAAAGLVLARRAALLGGPAMAMAALPPALLLAAFTFSGNLKNIGLRYVLSVYPYLCLLGGIGAVALWRSWRSYGRAAVLLLLIWAGAAEARIYPHHLTYFNEVAGGPDGGRWWLLDSNIDWGQDLKGLGLWMRENGIETVFLDYFGRGSPRYYGVRTQRRFEGGYIAVSATHLAGVYREEKTRYDFLQEVEPVAVIGNSILVYDVPRPAGWKPMRGGHPD
jgi:hypothetical protein